MRKSYLAAALLSGALLAGPLAAQAQANDQLLYVGTALGVGVGSYNYRGFATGLSARFQQPLVDNLSLTARSGFDLTTVKEDFRYSDTPGAVFSIPVTFGPRYYIVNGFHTDLNLGVDIALSEVIETEFRFEPAVGYTILLANNHYLDLGTSFITSFAEGSGIFSFNFAYSLNLSGLTKGQAVRPAPTTAPGPAYSPASPPPPLPAPPAPARQAGFAPVRKPAPAAPRPASPRRRASQRAALPSPSKTAPRPATGTATGSPGRGRFLFERSARFEQLPQMGYEYVRAAGVTAAVIAPNFEHPKARRPGLPLAL